MDALIRHGKPVTLDDVAQAQRFTAKLREQEPGLLAPAPLTRSSDEPPVHTTDEIIEERWDEVREWKRKNPANRRDVLFSMSVR